MGETIYFLNKVNNNVRMMLMMMEVTIGKYKVKFFLLMMMSPGSLPIHGIFSPINRSTPMAMIKTPKRMSNLPNPPNIQCLK